MFDLGMVIADSMTFRAVPEIVPSVPEPVEGPAEGNKRYTVPEPVEGPVETRACLPGP